VEETGVVWVVVEAGVLFFLAFGAEVEGLEFVFSIEVLRMTQEFLTSHHPSQDNKSIHNHKRMIHSNLHNLFTS
jgi:hypothetical protein